MNIYMWVVVIVWQKHIVFLPSIGQLAVPKFFSTKYMFAMVSAREYRKNLKKVFTFIH